jgi:hypothetical protein
MLYLFMSRWRIAALMVASAASVLLASSEPSSAAPPPATYTLQASLDPAARRLDGRGRIGWRNTTAEAIGELRLSLYYNAPRGDAAIRVTSIRLVSPDRDLLPSSAVSGAVLRVPLGAPVPPGGDVSFDITWVMQVPEDAALGGVVLVAHWFPRLVSIGDRGAYDVVVDVPKGWSIAATGREQPVSGVAARETRRFVQDGARDFAWAAGRDWIERRTHVERTGLSPVDIRVLARPEHAAALPRVTAAASVAVQQNSEWLAGYPYSDLTVLDLPWRTVHAGETYSGFVTVAARWLEPMRSTGLESAMADILAKHHWQQTVGIDPIEQPVMARGFAGYTASRLGSALVQRQLDSPSGDGFLVERFFGGFVPYVNRSIRFNHAAEHAPEDVARMARLLSTLEHYLGWPTLEMILDEFSTRFRFRQPGPSDFADVAASVSGRDLTWFFDQAFRQDRRFDYAVERVTAEVPPAGTAHRTTVVIGRLGEGIFSGATRPRTGAYESGRAMEIEVVFGDGTIRREHWDGRDARTAFVYESTSPVERVEVDPDRILRLETLRTNNSWTRVPGGPAAASRWSALWLLWLEDLLLTYATLA